MTKVTNFPRPGTGSEELLLDAADAAYLSALEAMRDLARGIGEGESPSRTEVSRLARDLSGAIQALMRERCKLDEIRREAEGAVRGYALDLQRARREVGRRLDRLRAAAGAG